ncbi:MAG: hypothetical protein ACRCZV_03900, partial [Sediminibacterium sp.]
SDLVSNMQDGAAQASVMAQNIAARTGDAISLANTKALGFMNLSVDKQSYFLAYLDTFRLIGIFFVLTIPLIIFLRTKKKTAEELAASIKAANEAH